ncbi:hypothetical protein CROQUDRAFT_97626 [Cronartium quercuum f. sp. fusiforme G11]|uniref:Uncharacterized protein n=1 Tax=Cronartium quercuum f. sp. fusiforme G11 TaxID=708437 RepID=A0A9P6NES2_9BASI|nr:hypothetical protein CROQUDRAFT_97626 [Cronartium quercuum f. sp. fusiforme G11]
MSERVVTEKPAALFTLLKHPLSMQRLMWSVVKGKSGDEQLAIDILAGVSAALVVDIEDTRVQLQSPLDLAKLIDNIGKPEILSRSS